MKCTLNIYLLKIIQKVILLLFLQFFFCPESSKASLSKTHHDMQAELLIEFLKYVKWDETKKYRSICVVGEGRLITKLVFLIKRRDIKLNVSSKGVNSFIEDCDVIVVNEEFKGILSRLLYRTQSLPMLTLGYVKGFAQKGGIIEINYLNERVELMINAESLKKSGLKIDRSIISTSIIY